MTQQSPPLAGLLASVDAEAIGHQRLDTSFSGAYASGDFVFLSNGLLVYGQDAYPDMARVEIHNRLIHATREPGYGKVLSVGNEDGGVRYRYIQRCWHRLMLGGPSLGPSLFYKIEMNLPEWKWQDLVLAPLAMRADSISHGPFSLHADGALRFFDLTFSPSDNVDIEAPCGAAARRAGTNRLALMIPRRGAMLPIYLRSSSPQTAWFVFEDGKWFALARNNA